MFELTASFLMKSQGKEQTFLKLPEFLKQSFGDGKNYLGIETGKKIMEWLDKGEKESPEILKVKSDLLMICEKGLNALELYYKALPVELKAAIKPHLEQYKESAKAYDKQAADATLEPNKEEERMKLLIDDATTIAELKKYLPDCNTDELIGYYEMKKLNLEAN